MKKYLFLLLFAFNSLIYAQNAEEFSDLYGDYLGQTPPTDTPVIFAPGIISKTTLEHSAAIFSSDGNEVYWVSRENQESKLSIWMMQRINNRWTEPEIINLLGDSVNLFDPYLTIDGKKLYFGADKNGNADIWYAERQGNTWNKPQNIGLPINNKDGQCQGSLTENGTIYYIDYRVIDKKWTCDILKSKFKNGVILKPDTLPVSINSKSSEDWTPFIAPDESYIIFSSRREQKYGDLYISFHDIQTDYWSEAINLGESINSPSQETFPVVSPDGRYLFFTRWTDEKNDMDVYWVSSSFIDSLKEKYLEKK